MPSSKLSRRDFSRTLSQSFAFLLAAPRIPMLAESQGKTSPDGMIHLNFNENPYGPSPKSLEALASCGAVASRYPFARYEALIDSLAHKHAVKPENIMLGCGSTEVLRVVDAVFLGPGKNVVAAEPTFEAILDYAKVMQGHAVKIPLTSDYRHDLPRMADACTSQTGVVYVCNPNNPTGTIVTRDELQSFIARVMPQTLILVDEAYFDFVEDPRYSTAIEWIESHPNVVIARTFSKIYGLAGMRLGYAVGAKETIARMKQQALQDDVNAAVLEAGLAGLSDAEGIGDCRSRINGTRRWLTEELAKDGRNFIPTQANFLMIDMGGDVQPFIEKFKARNILVGRRFPATPDFLRVTIGTQAETEKFLVALREIAPAKASRAA